MQRTENVIKLRFSRDHPPPLDGRLEALPFLGLRACDLTALALAVVRRGGLASGLGDPEAPAPVQDGTVDRGLVVLDELGRRKVGIADAVPHVEHVRLHARVGDAVAALEDHHTEPQLQLRVVQRREGEAEPRPRKGPAVEARLVLLGKVARVARLELEEHHVALAVARDEVHRGANAELLVKELELGQHGLQAVWVVRDQVEEPEHPVVHVGVLERELRLAERDPVLQLLVHERTAALAKVETRALAPARGRAERARQPALLDLLLVPGTHHVAHIAPGKAVVDDGANSGERGLLEGLGVDPVKALAREADHGISRVGNEARPGAVAALALHAFDRAHRVGIHFLVRVRRDQMRVLRASEPKWWVVTVMLLVAIDSGWGCAEISHYDIPPCIAARGFTSASTWALKTDELGTPARLRASYHAGAIELYHHCACVLQLGYPTLCPTAYAQYTIRAVCDEAFPDGPANATVPLRYSLRTIGPRQTASDPYPCRGMPGVSSALGDTCTASAAWEFVPGEERSATLVLTVNDQVLPVLQERFDVASANADERIMSHYNQLFHKPDNGNTDLNVISLLEDADQTMGCYVFYSTTKIIGTLVCGSYDNAGQRIEILFDNPVAITEAEFAAVLATAPTPTPPPSPTPTNTLGTPTPPPTPLPTDGPGKTSDATSELLESPWGLLLAFHVGTLLLGYLGA